MHPKTVSMVVAGLALAASAAPPASAQTPLHDTDFQVNAFTRGSQGVHQAVAADPHGNFVVVWGGKGRGSDAGIFGRRFDSAGNPRGGDFQVNGYTTRAGNPAVAADATGGFVVVWLATGAGDDDVGLFARRFDGRGAPRGDEFRVNSYPQSHLWYPAVAASPAGDFLVVWTTSYPDSGFDLLGRWYDSRGTARGRPFRVNSHTAGLQFDKSLAADAAGNFIVVWTNEDTTGDAPPEVVGRRYDRTGTPVGDEFGVVAAMGASVATSPDGAFVVTAGWADGQNSIVGRRYDSAGEPLGGEFHVNTDTTGEHVSPVVALDAAGNFLVAWTRQNRVGAPDVLTRLYDRSGNAVAEEVRANTVPAIGSYSPEARQLHPTGATRFVDGSLQAIVDSNRDLRERHVLVSTSICQHTRSRVVNPCLDVRRPTVIESRSRPCSMPVVQRCSSRSCRYRPAPPSPRRST